MRINRYVISSTGSRGYLQLDILGVGLAYFLLGKTTFAPFSYLKTRESVMLSVAGQMHRVSELGQSGQTPL